MAKAQTGALMTFEDGIDFEFHVEGDELVIDKCEGITPEEGLSFFPRWIIEAMLK